MTPAPQAHDLPRADPPLVSVIMTVFNGAQHVQEAVWSILDQPFADFELIVVDDGSGDHSAARASARADPRLRLVQRPHEGRVAALNHAVKLARGTYVANLDSDDRALPGRLTIPVAYLETHPDVAAAGSATVLAFGEGAYRSGRHLPCSAQAIRWSYLTRNPLFHSSMTYRRAILEEVGGYDEAYSGYADDADLGLRIAQRYDIVNLSPALAAKRRHRGQVFAALDPKLRSAVHATIRMRAARELPFSPAQRPVAMSIARMATARSRLAIGLMDLAAQRSRRVVALPSADASSRISSGQGDARQ